MATAAPPTGVIRGARLQRFPCGQMRPDFPDIFHAHQIVTNNRNPWPHPAAKTRWSLRAAKCGRIFRIYSTHIKL